MENHKDIKEAQLAKELELMKREHAIKWREQEVQKKEQYTRWFEEEVDRRYNEVLEREAELEKRDEELHMHEVKLHKREEELKRLMPKEEEPTTTASKEDVKTRGVDDDGPLKTSCRPEHFSERISFWKGLEARKKSREEELQRKVDLMREREESILKTSIVPILKKSETAPASNKTEDSAPSKSEDDGPVFEFGSVEDLKTETKEKEEKAKQLKKELKAKEESLMKLKLERLKTDGTDASTEAQDMDIKKKEEEAAKVKIEMDETEIEVMKMQRDANQLEDAVEKRKYFENMKVKWHKMWHKSSDTKTASF